MASETHSSEIQTKINEAITSASPLKSLKATQVIEKENAMLVQARLHAGILQGAATVHDRLAAKPADHLFETPSSQVLVQARLHADIQRQATNVHSRHVENHENLVKVSQAVSPLILEARLHAGIAKGTQNLKHVETPQENFEAVKQGYLSELSPVAEEPQEFKQ